MPLPHDLTALLPFAGLAAACVALIWLTTRGALARAAVRRMLTRPGLLVPAAMTTAGVVALMLLSRDPRVDENPLVHAPGLVGFDGPASAWSWLALALAAAGIAGQIGLLEGLEQGRRPDATGMLHGIRRHFWTIALAKLAIAGGAVLLMGLGQYVRADRASLILYLVPSLFVAPVIGLASRHPGRPVAALADAVRTASGNLFGVGWPVLSQALALVGFLVLARRLDEFRAALPPADVLAGSASAVSFNHFPFATMPIPGGVATLLTFASIFVSATFVTAHWLGGCHGYDAVRQLPPQAQPDAPSA